MRSNRKAVVRSSPYKQRKSTKRQSLSIAEFFQSDEEQVIAHTTSPKKRKGRSLGAVSHTVTRTYSPEKQTRKTTGSRSDAVQTKTNAVSPGRRTRKSPGAGNDGDQAVSRTGSPGKQIHKTKGANSNMGQTVAHRTSPRKRKQKITDAESDTGQPVVWDSPEQVEEARRMRKKKGIIY